MLTKTENKCILLFQDDLAEDHQEKADDSSQNQKPQKVRLTIQVDVIILEVKTQIEGTKVGIDTAEKDLN